MCLCKTLSDVSAAVDLELGLDTAVSFLSARFVSQLSALKQVVSQSVTLTYSNAVSITTITHSFQHYSGCEPSPALLRV